MKVCHKCGAQYDGEESFCPLDGEVLQDNHAEMVGRILDGQYQIEEFIAEGGMGAVYRARHTLLGDKVAIKILPPEMRRNSAWLKRFQREGQAARRFHHPNSVIVHDLRASSEGDIYLVMEFVEGRTLDAEVAARGGRLSLTEALQIIEPVASVLDAAHAMGVVHRDLKPSNIMITNRGIVKLLDLGLAKMTDLGAGVTNLTVTGQILGTPHFMSPEQWGESQRDGSEEIDGRTDIYSLGVIVYQLTTGDFPFKGTSIVTLRRAHCHEMPRPLEEYDPNIPPEWSRAVLRAMSKDRSDRQLTAGDFAGELSAAVGGGNVRYESPRSFQPTIINQPQQATSPGVHATPQNLQAQTVNLHEGATQGVERTVAPTVAPTFNPPTPDAPTIERRPPSNTRWLVAIVATLMILAVGLFAIWQWRGGRWTGRGRAKSVQANNQADSQEDAPVNQSSPTAVGDESAAPLGDAFIRYHLQLAPTILDDWVPNSGRDPIASGQIVQFVFKSRESGYLYMFGHDDAGNTIVMPLDADGLEKVTAGAKVTASQEGVFPSLPLIKLDAPSGEENFTVFFSDKPLSFPFVNATLPLDGSFRKLTADEQRQLDELRKQSVPATIQFDGDAVAVKLEGERGTKTVVFDIKLKLRRS
ncbi:MAG TPA: protein kinase [Pyrinomonadaceae bacterium]